MTIHQAEQFIVAYQEILADESKRGSRRDPSLLPAPKEWVMKAIKLEIVQLYLLNSHTNESITKPLINAAMFLDSFMPEQIPTKSEASIKAMKAFSLNRAMSRISPTTARSATRSSLVF